MTRVRWIGLLLLLLGSGIFVSWGTLLDRVSPDRMGDFKIVYYGTQCLLSHCDPYNESELKTAYQLRGWKLPTKPLQIQGATVYVYLPTASIFFAPFAMLPWEPAHVLWMILSAGTLILASFLIWKLAARYAPILSGCLIGLLLANAEVVLACGNAAAIVIGFCAIAVWCFLEEQFVPVGILCLAVSLAIKPHDAGLVWLYFLLAGGSYRKRALQTLLMVVALGLPSVLWVAHVSPHWVQELHSNISFLSASGNINNPEPSQVQGPAPDTVMDLQTVISVFRDDPRIYNPVCYLICGALLLAWLIRTLRSHFSQTKVYLALATIVPLTMLVTYHRPHDAKLLMLAVPACAVLWAEGGAIRWIALVVTTTGLVLTGDVSLALLSILGNNLHVGTAGIFDQMMMAVFMRPASLALLVMGVFYLWAYMRRDSEQAATPHSRASTETPGHMSA